MGPAGRSAGAVVAAGAVGAAKPERFVRRAAIPAVPELSRAITGAPRRAIRRRQQPAASARSVAIGPRVPIGLKGATRSSGRNVVLWIVRREPIAASRAPAAASGATDDPAAVDRRAKGPRGRPARAPNRADAGIGATDGPAAVDRGAMAENLAAVRMPAGVVSGATDGRQTMARRARPESPAVAPTLPGAVSGATDGPAAADRRVKREKAATPAGAASGAIIVRPAAGRRWREQRVSLRRVPILEDAARGASRAGTAVDPLVKDTKAEHRGAVKLEDAARGARVVTVVRAVADPRRAPMPSSNRAKAIAGCASRLPPRAVRRWDDLHRLRRRRHRWLLRPYRVRGRPAWQWRGRSPLPGPRLTG